MNDKEIIKLEYGMITILTNYFSSEDIEKVEKWKAQKARADERQKIINHIDLVIKYLLVRDEFQRGYLAGFSDLKTTIIKLAQSENNQGVKE